MHLQRCSDNIYIYDNYVGCYIDYVEAYCNFSGNSVYLCNRNDDDPDTCSYYGMSNKELTKYALDNLMDKYSKNTYKHTFKKIRR